MLDRTILFAYDNSDNNLLEARQMLVYALKEEKLVSIDEVERGLLCGCVCPACGQQLIARKGPLKEHHFAHVSGIECEDGFETSLHRVAKELLSEAKTIYLPALEYREHQIIEDKALAMIHSVSVEKSLGTFVPDILIDTDKGQYCIEIAVTHKANAEKIEKIRVRGIDTFEIDLKNVDKAIKKEELKNIFLRFENTIYGCLTKWLYNNDLERYKLELEEKERIELAELEAKWLKKREALKRSRSICPACGGSVVLLEGKYGLYYKCQKCGTHRSARCKKCGAKLMLKENHKTGELFLGCNSYPRCKYSEKVSNNFKSRKV